jgi:hypothetical protein
MPQSNLCGVLGPEKHAFHQLIYKRDGRDKSKPTLFNLLSRMWFLFDEKSYRITQSSFHEFFWGPVVLARVYGCQGMEPLHHSLTHQGPGHINYLLVADPDFGEGDAGTCFEVDFPRVRDLFDFCDEVFAAPWLSAEAGAGSGLRVLGLEVSDCQLQIGGRFDSLKPAGLEEERSDFCF